MAFGKWLRWDSVNKVFEISTNGGVVWTDLEQNVICAPGSAAVPAIRAAADLNTGISFPGSNQVDINGDGRLILRTLGSAANHNMYMYDPSGAQYFMWNIPNASYMYMSMNGTSAATIYLRNNTNATIRFGTNAVDRWHIDETGHLEPLADNSYNIGAAGQGVKGLFLKGAANNLAGIRHVMPVVVINGNGMTTAPGVVYVCEWKFKGTILSAWARRIGGTGATVNARKGGTDIRSADLSLTTTAWTNFGTLQNNTFVSGNDFDVEIATVAGSPTEIAIYLEIERSI